jgi:hypothetical protein
MGEAGGGGGAATAGWAGDHEGCSRAESSSIGPTNGGKGYNGWWRRVGGMRRDRKKNRN